MIKLSKFDLISPSPYLIDDVGHINAIRLRDIDSLPHKYDTYRQYLSVLLLDIEDYVKQFKIPQSAIDRVKEQFLAEGMELCVFDLHIINQDILSVLIVVMDFFIQEDVSYDVKDKKFIIYNGIKHIDGRDEPDNIVGCINRDNYQDVVDVILQRLGVKSAEDIEEEHPKFANKKAQEMWERQQEFFKKQREKESDKNQEFFELGNIISALAYRKDGLNMINIWDMTLYNVLNQFEFQRDGVVYDISALNYSVWGSDDKHKFDIDAWFKRKAPVAGGSDDLFSMAQNAKNR